LKQDLLQLSILRKAGAKLAWIDYNYKGFPLIATKLSQLQADIKRQKVMSGMFQTDWLLQLH
jgi:hypothetical protein